jgi:hypothetical protein
VRVVLGTDGIVVTAPPVVDPAVPAPVPTPVGTTYAAGACIN